MCVCSSGEKRGRRSEIHKTGRVLNPKQQMLFGCRKLDTKWAIMNPFLPLHQYHRFAMVSNGKSSTSKNERIQFMLSLIDTHTHTTMEMAKNGIRFRRSHLSCSSFSVSSHCVNTRCEFFFYSALSFFFMFAHRRFQSKWCFFSFCSLWNS